MKGRSVAVALGVVLAFLFIGYLWAYDDMTTTFCPAATAIEPYRAGFFYPPWCLYFLKAICHMPRWAATLAGIWSVLIVVICSRTWATPTWLPLLAPPFLAALGWGHPFEAMVFLGLTLIVRGHTGVGLALLAFKPQLGIVPGLYVAWRHRRKWRVFMPAVVLIVGTTAVDFALTGRPWVIPFCSSIGTLHNAAWNASLWQAFSWLSLLWLPIGIWLLLSQNERRRRLFIAYALGLLLVPYWAAYSLWPLTAMSGCWKTQKLHWQSPATA